MRKNKKTVISLIMVLSFLVSILGNTLFASAKALPVPTPIVYGINTVYNAGDYVNIKLASSGISTMVQYKAVLYNDTTKKSVDLINGYTSKYYNPLYKYSLSFPVNEPGKYTLVVTSKRAGYKSIYSRSVSKKFTVNGDNYTVEKVEPIYVKVNVGDTYSFPEKVKALMKDGSTKELNVLWENPVFGPDQIGTDVFYGKVEGYKDRVQLTLERVDERIEDVPQVQVSIAEGEDYMLPQKVTAIQSDGKSREVEVKWVSNTVNTDIPGMYTFEGSVDGYDKKVILSLRVNEVPLDIKSISSPGSSQVDFEFNKKVNIDTASPLKISLYMDKTAIPVNAVLSDNKRKLSIQLKDINMKLEKGRGYTAIFGGLKDSSGREIKPFVKDFIYNDLICGDPDTIQAGDMSAPTKYSPTGEFLYFGNIPLNADKLNADMDSNGILMIRINGKLVYDPVSIAQYGLQEYSYYMKDKDAEHMGRVIKAADWLVSNQDKASGMWHYNFPFAVGGMGVTLESGWGSAMGQGQAISLLVRTYDYTHEEKYLDTAELGLKPLKKDVEDGGLTRDFFGHKYYEEYPTSPPSFALNGFMFTLLGLYDLSVANTQSGAAELYKEGIETLKFALPYYDGAEEKISYYHLGHITNPPRETHTSDFYHKVHIIQLTAFASIDPDPVFVKYRDLWLSYMDK